jgi:hypothetical protein
MLTCAGKGHRVLEDSPPATSGSGRAGVTFSGVVDLGGRTDAQRGQERGRRLCPRRGGEEPELTDTLEPPPHLMCGNGASRFGFVLWGSRNGVRR